MNSLFNEPEYNFGVKNINGIMMIPTNEIANTFCMRHSNVMRSVTTAMKHIPETPADYYKTTFMCNGKVLDRYFISHRVLSIVLKRTDNKVVRDNLIDYMTGKTSPAESEPGNAAETPAAPVAPETPATPAMPDNTIAAAFDRMTAAINAFSKAMDGINAKLDWVIKNTVSKSVPIPDDIKPEIKVSNEPVSVAELAKMLCQSGVNIGEMRLFTWLRDNQFLCSTGSEYNLPRQKYIEQGIFVIKTSRVQLPTGQVVEKHTTKVTAKGQEYFINKFVYNAVSNR